MSNSVKVLYVFRIIPAIVWMECEFPGRHDDDFRLLESFSGVIFIFSESLMP